MNEKNKKIEKDKIKYIKSSKTVKRSNYFYKRKNYCIEEFKGNIFNDTKTKHK